MNECASCRLADVPRRSRRKNRSRRERHCQWIFDFHQELQVSSHLKSGSSQLHPVWRNIAPMRARNRGNGLSRGCESLGRRLRGFNLPSMPSQLNRMKRSPRSHPSRGILHHRPAWPCRLRNFGSLQRRHQAPHRRLRSWCERCHRSLRTWLRFASCDNRGGRQCVRATGQLHPGSGRPMRFSRCVLHGGHSRLRSSGTSRTRSLRSDGSQTG